MPLTSEQKTDRSRKRQLAKALEEEARANRLETRRREWNTKGMYLSREEAADGEPCRGCGLPVIDHHGDWPATTHLSPVERIEYDAMQEQFRERHPKCESSRWNMAGSRAMHCGDCCPPLPLTEAQREHVLGILRRSTPSAGELDVWERLLTCGHRIQQNVHYTSSGPSFLTHRCEQCGRTRGVVSSEKILDSTARIVEAKRRGSEAIARAERDLKRAEKIASDTRWKLDELRSRTAREV